MEKRKIGKRKMDLSGETTEELLKKTKSLVRADWGGKIVELGVMDELAAAGIPPSEKLVKAVSAMVKRQLKSSRERVSHRMDEAIRRARNGQLSIPATSC